MSLMKFHEERKSKFMTIKGTFMSGNINKKLDLLVPRVSSTYLESRYFLTLE